MEGRPLMSSSVIINNTLSLPIVNAQVVVLLSRR